MYILGLSSYAHESSCALIKNGEVKVVLEEERFNREKHTCKFPAHAIEEALRYEGIGINQVDHITFYWVPQRELLGNMLHMLKYFPKSLQLLSPASGANELSFFARVYAKQRIAKQIQRHFNLSKAPYIHFIEHHLSHAASAFFVSPFKEAAILTIDGRGESTSTMMAVGRGNKIEKIQEIKVPHSLGHLYASLTHYLGFWPFSDEWKVMGMSAYGKPTYVDDFKDLVFLDPSFGYRLNLSYFDFHLKGQRSWVSKKFIKKFGPIRLKNEEYDQRHFDIAYALQNLVETTGVYLAQEIQSRTNYDSLCMAGGVVLNCLMNKKIVEETNFKNFFFQPIANDAGTSLGSALYLYHQQLNHDARVEFSTPYLGNKYSNEEVELALKDKGLTYRKSDNIEKETAAFIAENKVVGWFQGRMESGPRALGNRSITVNPTDAAMKDKLNALVKKREFFRPFAPSVLEEKAAQYFNLPKNQMSPYMILIADVKEEKKAIIPAVTHADGTARVHTVNQKSNARYWKLIAEFEKLTGVPILLNTSFNENEPIVCTPLDAINCFLRSEFDVLAIEDFLVLKDENRELA